MEWLNFRNLPHFFVFADDVTSTIWISRRAIIKTISQKFSKLQFLSSILWVKLNKMSNLIPEWDKMTERSSVLKELVQYSSENILSHINLTWKSTASFDNCHETNNLIQIEALVSNFWVKRFIHVKNFLTIWRELSNTNNSAILDF